MKAKRRGTIRGAECGIARLVVITMKLIHKVQSQTHVYQIHFPPSSSPIGKFVLFYCKSYLICHEC